MDLEPARELFVAGVDHWVDGEDCIDFKRR